jgi:hypothetical protein
MIDDVYIVQICILALCLPLLVACVYMAYKSRAALNGMARSLILLLALLALLVLVLIVRRVFDSLGFMDDVASLVFSSAVTVTSFFIALLTTVDVYYLYRNRAVYAARLENRRNREAQLEAIRERSERISGAWNR